MKTYKDFKIFINSPEYCNVVWGHVKEKALEQGFKSWQFALYQWWFLRKFHFRSIRIFIRKTLKYLWYIFVFAGLFCLSWDLHNLMKSTTRKNDVVTLSYIAHTCTEYPNLCERIADKGGYVLKKGK